MKVACSITTECALKVVSFVNVCVVCIVLMMLSNMQSQWYTNIDQDVMSTPQINLTILVDSSNYKNLQNLTKISTETHNLYSKSANSGIDYIYSYYNHSNKRMESYLSLVILGAAKAGTTSFAIALKQFNDIITSNYENHYWNRCDISPQRFKQLRKYMYNTTTNNSCRHSRHTHNISIPSKKMAARGKFWLQLIDTYNSSICTNANSDDYRKLFLFNLSNMMSGLRGSNVGGSFAAKFKACDIQEYGQRLWLIKRQFKGDMNYNYIKNNAGETSFDPFKQKCNHPKLYIDNSSFSDNKQKCIFIDKSPSYTGRPLTPSIVLATKFATVKGIFLVRNPIDLIWSYTFNFDKQMKQLWRSKDQEREEYLTQYLHNLQSEYYEDGNINIFNLRNECINYNFNENMFDWQSFFVKLMLCTRVYCVHGCMGESSSKMILKQSFFQSMIFIPIMSYIYVYDTIYGFGGWNQIKILQSEWIFDNENLVEAVLLVRCWIHGDKKEYNYYNYYDKKQCLKYNSKTKKIIGKEYYNQVLSKLKNKQHTKANKKTQSKLENNSTLVQSLIEFFAPCVRATNQLLLKNRKNLLIGGWVDWNQKYNYSASYTH